MSRIEEELKGKTPAEQYDFLVWLLQNYAYQFVDSKAAVINWLSEPVEGEDANVQ